MPVVVRKVITLVWERSAGLVCALPPGASPPHEMRHGAFAHASVGHPTAVLDCVLASVPVRDAMDPHVRMRRMERHGMDQAAALDHPGGAVGSRIIGATSGVLRGRHVLEERGLIACCDAEKSAQTVGVEGRDRRGLGTQTVGGDHAREVGMVLAQRGHHTCGGLACTSMFVRPIRRHQWFRPQWHDGTHGWMHQRCTAPLRQRGDRTMAVDVVQTRCTGHRLGGQRARPSERPSRVPIETRQQCTCLAPLEWPQDARERWAEPRGGERVKDGAQARVARDPRTAVDGVHMPRGPFLVKGQERGRWEGKHGPGRHERIGAGHLGIANTGIWEAGNIAVPQAKERIGGQLLPSLWRHHGQNTPRHMDIGSCLYGGIFACTFTKRQREY